MWKAVLFDVDGTLLDTEKIYMEAWRQACASAGYAVTHDVLLRTRAVPEAVSKRIFQEALGQDLDYSAIRQERIQIAEALIAASGDLLKPGAKMVLDYLKNKGIPMAVASSTGTQKTMAHLDHAGLLGYFDAIVCGDMVERGKPNPDIFWKAAGLLGMAYEDCVVVGDTPADVKAGTAAGMQVLLIPDQVPANEETTALSLAVLARIDRMLDFF